MLLDLEVQLLGSGQLETADQEDQQHGEAPRSPETCRSRPSIANGSGDPARYEGQP